MNDTTRREHNCSAFGRMATEPLLARMAGHRAASRLVQFSATSCQPIAIHLWVSTYVRGRYLTGAATLVCVRKTWLATESAGIRTRNGRAGSVRLKGRAAAQAAFDRARGRLRARRCGRKHPQIGGAFRLRRPVLAGQSEL